VKKVSRAKRQLHWVCHSPSHYNDFLFRALALSPALALKVHYLSSFSSAYQWDLSPDPGYSAAVLRGRFFDWRLVRAVLGNRNSLFLTSCWQDPTCQLILLALMVLGRPYMIWNDSPAPRHRGWIKRTLRAAFLRAAFQRAIKVLGAGKLALRIFAEMGAPSEKLLNFPYCVDVARFMPGNDAKSNTPFVLGTCARLERVKGVDIALRALAKCRQSFLYRIAGTGREEPTLRELVRELGLTDRVEFCGWLQPSELPAFYRSLDVYLQPARFEPYGVAVVEALSCGIPILASDQTGAALDRVAGDENQFLHRSDDPDDLLRIVNKFLTLKPAERERVQQNARRAALSWTVEDAVETIARIADGLESNASNAGSLRVGEQA